MRTSYTLTLILVGSLCYLSYTPVNARSLTATLRHKRNATSSDTHHDGDIYSRTTSQLADTLYNTLFNNILNGSQLVDITLLLDSSIYMGEDRFNTARHFLARIINILPKSMFRNGTIRTGMITYSTIGQAMKEFDFSYTRGHFKEMIRRSVRAAQYQGGIENHGCQALAWSYELLTNSSRSRLPGTKNVIIYATNGNVTDQDSYFGPMYNSWTHAANWFKEKGITMLMLPIGNTGGLNKSNLQVMASNPVSSYIIPVVDNSDVDNLILRIKNRRRSQS